MKVFEKTFVLIKLNSYMQNRNESSSHTLYKNSLKVMKGMRMLKNYTFENLTKNHCKSAWLWISKAFLIMTPKAQGTKEKLNFKEILVQHFGKNFGSSSNI